MTYLMVLGGLVLLLAGGDLLVRGAVRIGERTGLTPLVVGMVIVGFGTSSPELFVAVQSSLADAGSLALGNVIGSNISNVLLILGATALVRPIPRPESFFLTDGFILLAITAGVLWLATTGMITEVQGWILVALLATFITFQVARCYIMPEASAAQASAAAREAEGGKKVPIGLALVFLLAGFALLWFGSDLLVSGSVDLARSFGVSEALIGITIVAVGTSLPELASSITAAVRGHHGVAYGNIVGSNIFNTLGIVGAAAVVKPLEIGSEVIAFDGPVMLGVAVLMLIAMATGRGISRFEGLVLLAVYAGYVAVRTAMDVPTLA